jgi:hypothetical protein
MIGTPPAEAKFNSELDTLCILHKTKIQAIDLEYFRSDLGPIGAAGVQRFAFHHSFFKGDSFADLEDDDGMFSRFFQVLASFSKLKTLGIVVGEQAYSGPINLINPPRRSLPGPRIQAVSIISDGKSTTWKQLEDNVQEFLAKAVAGEHDTDNISFLKWDPPTVKYKVISSHGTRNED